MTKTFSFIAILPVVASLAACGSSGGGGSKSFNELAREGNALLSSFEDSDPTPVASMPTTGKATYRGVAAYGDVPDPEYLAENAEIVSEVELNANFASGNVGGKLDNFRLSNNDRINGSVAVRNGRISGNELTADLAGNLSYDGARDRVDGAMAGFFVDDDADGVIGAMAGEIGSDRFYSVFGAER